MRVLDLPTALFVKSFFIVHTENLFTNPSPLEWETVRMPFGRSLVKYGVSTTLIDEQDRSGAHDTGGIDAITYDPCNSP